MFAKTTLFLIVLLALHASCQYYGGYPTAGGYYGNSIYGGSAYGGYGGFGYPNYYGEYGYGSPFAGYVGKRSSGFGKH